MLSSTLGIDLDIDKSFDEKKELWKISGKIVRTANITQSAAGDKRGLWTTVVAAAIFITD
jgi:arginine decarboxylase